jgi:hypothetical protein
LARIVSPRQGGKSRKIPKKTEPSADKVSKFIKFPVRTRGSHACAKRNGPNLTCQWFPGTAGVKPELFFACLEQAGISPELCSEASVRVTEEQFSTLYRTLAIDLDDEMPSIFCRPFRSGTLKFLCLSLLDARSLDTALRRFGQFFHIVLDDFRFTSRRDDLICEAELSPNSSYRAIGSLGQQLMLKLAYGVSSWLIGQ